MDVHQSRKSSNLHTRRRGISKNNESTRGFESDTGQVPRVPVSNESGRRVWTFKGTAGQPKRTLSNRPPAARRTVTASSSRRTSLSVKPKRTASMAKLNRSNETPLIRETERVGRSRSKSTRRSHSQLSGHLESARSKSRVSSIANSSVGSVAGANSVDVEIAVSEKDGLLRTNEASIAQPIIDSKTDDKSYRDLMTASKPVLPEEAMNARPGPKQRPESPCVTSYRKIVYNEKENKWVEYEKLCENEDFYEERMKREQGYGLPPPRSPIIEKPRRLKGRQTERLQLMFPTALVLDKRHREYHEKLKMTDQLRLELHRRHVQVVPTHFQKHILKFGKLPFRNNPRPHLIY